MVSFLQHCSTFASSMGGLDGESWGVSISKIIPFNSFGIVREFLDKVTEYSTTDYTVQTFCFKKPLRTGLRFFLHFYNDCKGEVGVEC